MVHVCCVVLATDVPTCGADLSGLLTVLSMDMKALLAGPHHYLLYALAPTAAMHILMLSANAMATLPVVWQAWVWAAC
jgi:hypothetical protein